MSMSPAWLPTLFCQLQLLCPRWVMLPALSAYLFILMLSHTHAAMMLAHVVPLHLADGVENCST